MIGKNKIIRTAIRNGRFPLEISFQWGKAGLAILLNLQLDPGTPSSCSSLLSRQPATSAPATPCLLPRGCNAGSLTHWARPGTKPATSWFLVGFVNHCTTTGTPHPRFYAESNLISSDQINSLVVSTPLGQALRSLFPPGPQPSSRSQRRCSSSLQPHSLSVFFSGSSFVTYPPPVIGGFPPRLSPQSFEHTLLSYLLVGQPSSWPFKPCKFL